MQVLRETDDLIAVAKPPGIAVVPARGEERYECLHSRLQAARGERLWVVHRLDRDTSGAIVFARTADAHRRLSIAFERRLVEKVYRVWTRGVPEPREGTIDVPLHAARRGKMRPAAAREAGALDSTTTYRVLRATDTSLGPIATLEARPATGRQHQIRVHLRAIATPALVDPLYGGTDRIAAGALGAGSPPIGRLTLHAATLELPGEPVIEAPMPGDLGALDTWLASVG